METRGLDIHGIYFDLEQGLLCVYDESQDTFQELTWHDRSAEKA